MGGERAGRIAGHPRMRIVCQGLKQRREFLGRRLDDSLFAQIAGQDAGQLQSACGYLWDDELREVPVNQLL